MNMVRVEPVQGSQRGDSLGGERSGGFEDGARSGMSSDGGKPGMLGEDGPDALVGVASCVAGALSFALQQNKVPGRTMVLLGLFQVLLHRGLGLRFVGFGDAKSIRLPRLERKGRGLPQWDGACDGAGGGGGGGGGAGKTRLRVLSHNVWCHMLQQWYTPPAAKRLRCLVEAIKARDYDVVMLQELFLLRLGPLATTLTFEAFAQAMLAAGYRLVADPRDSLPMVGQNSGLAIFSKLDPVRAPVARSFAVTGEQVCVKGYLHAELRVAGNRTIHVVTTHLDSKKKPKDVQHSQARQIRDEVLTSVLASDSPAALVAGDFNVCSLLTKDDGTAYRRLCAAMTPLVDAFGPGQQSAEVRPTRRAGMKPFSSRKSGDKLKGAIDHAFVFGLTSITSEVVDLRCPDKTVVSDHLGLELGLELS